MRGLRRYALSLGHKTTGPHVIEVLSSVLEQVDDLEVRHLYLVEHYLEIARVIWGAQQHPYALAEPLPFGYLGKQHLGFALTYPWAVLLRHLRLILQDSLVLTRWSFLRHVQPSLV